MASPGLLLGQTNDLSKMERSYYRCRCHCHHRRPTVVVVAVVSVFVVVVVVVIVVVVVVVVLLHLSSSRSNTIQNLEVLASKLTKLWPFWFRSKKEDTD